MESRGGKTSAFVNEKCRDHWIRSLNITNIVCEKNQFPIFDPILAHRQLAGDSPVVYIVANVQLLVILARRLFGILSDIAGPAVVPNPLFSIWCSVLQPNRVKAVSYTHLTLPTIYSV